METERADFWGRESEVSLWVDVVDGAGKCEVGGAGEEVREDFVEEFGWEVRLGHGRLLD